MRGPGAKLCTQMANRVYLQSTQMIPGLPRFSYRSLHLLALRNTHGAGMLGNEASFVTILGAYVPESSKERSFIVVWRNEQNSLCSSCDCLTLKCLPAKQH